MAVDYNEFIAQTTNRQTVLNILRAREREPMHFTSFSDVTGQIRGQGSASIGGPINGDSAVATGSDTMTTNAGPGGATTGTVVTATRTLTDNLGATNIAPTLGIQINTGTDFRVASNATEEFYRGILNPVAPSTVVHYLRQGYPADLLSHLLIGRLELNALITRPDGSRETILLKTINNNPDEAGSAREFTHAIRCRKLDYAIDRQDRRRLPIGDLTSLAPIAPDTIRRIHPRGTPAQPDAPAYELEVPGQTSFTLELSEPDAAECSGIRSELDERIRGWAARQGPPLIPRPPEQENGRADPLAGQLPSDVRFSPEQAPQGGDRTLLGSLGEVRFSAKGYFNPHLPEGWQGDLSVDVTLRSTQGVLYYLGEYIRVTDMAQLPLLQGGHCGYCLPVIRVLPVDDVPREARFVEVGYRGRRYAVPLSGGALTREYGRSSQTIDIVQQLLNLNRRASDLPTTPLLRVIN